MDNSSDMPMRWRFASEDEQDARTVVSLRKWEDLSGAQSEYAVADAVEDWAEREFGSWEDGDLVEVVVLSPKNMAGLYHVSLARSCSAVAYLKQTETTE